MFGLGFWGTFYLACVAGTLFYSHFPIRPLYGRQHVFGAEIIAASWAASWWARAAFADETPLEAYALIDVLTILAFSFPMLRKRAAWAAVCVILHAGMLCLHLAYYVTGEHNRLLYIWMLNSLFFASLVSINTAIAAGRHVWGERLDQLVMARFRGVTWSGLSLPSR